MLISNKNVNYYSGKFELVTRSSKREKKSQTVTDSLEVTKIKRANR